ncbi:hypothetical protein [Actinokineospora iranica]|uniref:L-tyrosine 3-hydroxylase n=1 Tax=Actinokineospora iranica TaxID=1271860 RepID=A0A1G6S8X1_9PSEU|nr:hypothetical protein [Actinokineospora iranica]SDD12567.1 hypothetical protein SAMN05216174_107260 [Actinokineospora iranica]
MTMIQTHGVDTCLRVPDPGPVGTVEPLVLPEAPPPDAGERPHRCPQPIAADLALLRLAAEGGRPRLLTPPEDERERIRYRWWVGHHAAFALWQTLTATLDRILREPRPSPRTVDAATRMLDCYSVLFLYSGSCSAEQYAATLRRDMHAYDPAFSGTWARDYERIPELLLRVKHRHPRSLVGPLNRASRANKLAHVAIAKKLVPNGASLLREAGRCPHAGAMGNTQDRYDAFFRVRRERVCERVVAAQLVRRLAQVLRDLADEPDLLARGGSARDPQWARAVRGVADDGPAILTRFADILARRATGGSAP